MLVQEVSVSHSECALLVLRCYARLHRWARGTGVHSPGPGAPLLYRVLYVALPAVPCESQSAASFLAPHLRVCADSISKSLSVSVESVYIADAVCNFTHIRSYIIYIIYGIIYKDKPQRRPVTHTVLR